MGGIFSGAGENPPDTEHQASLIQPAPLDAITALQDERDVSISLSFVSNSCRFTDSFADELFCLIVILTLSYSVSESRCFIQIDWHLHVTFHAFFKICNVT